MRLFARWSRRKPRRPHREQVRQFAAQHRDLGRLAIEVGQPIRHQLMHAAEWNAALLAFHEYASQVVKREAHDERPLNELCQSQRAEAGEENPWGGPLRTGLLLTRRPWECFLSFPLAGGRAERVEGRCLSLDVPRDA